MVSKCRSRSALRENLRVQLKQLWILARDFDLDLGLGLLGMDIGARVRLYEEGIIKLD